MKNQTLFPHKTFLHQNAIDISKLPELLQKRIHGFEELEQDLLSTVDEDRGKLLDRMQDLSHEIDEDLEEHFESELENNDEQDDEQNGEQDDDKHEHEAPRLPTELSPKSEHECGCKHAKKHEPVHLAGEEPLEPTSMEIPITPLKEKETAKNDLSDEDILENLLSLGWRKILPEDLRKKGFKTPLDFKVIVVGNFYLKKGRYDTHYEILRGWS
jgi:hypothetical protein